MTWKRPSFQSIVSRSPPKRNEYCVRRGSNVRICKAQPCLPGTRFFLFFALALTASVLSVPVAVAQSVAPAVQPPVPSTTHLTAGSPVSGHGVEVAGRFDATAKRTRFVIGLEKPSQFSVFALTSPNRVIVELKTSQLELPDQIGNTPVGLIQSFRGGISAPGRQRVIINVTSPVVVDRQLITAATNGKGHQLELDMVPVPAAHYNKLQTAAVDMPPSRLGVQPPLPRPAETPDHRAKRAFKPIIVIDPGHGGHDTGATKLGTVEKNVVLAFSKVLKEQLEATGRYKILMTRDTDVFVGLDERRAFAERHNASLFIAVHADYATSRARGATIYTLRNSVAERLKASTTRDVANHLLSRDEIDTVKGNQDDVSAVKHILADLARREVNVTQERTDIFARSIVARMSTSTNMRNDPDKQAAFRVLKTAQFPSVLIELAYVSNRKDAALLKSRAWRSKVAGSIVDAVDNYFGQQLARLPL